MDPFVVRSLAGDGLLMQSNRMDSRCESSTVSVVQQHPSAGTFDVCPIPTSKRHLQAVSKSTSYTKGMEGDFHVLGKIKLTLAEFAAHLCT
jgi:hypothetical protein